MTLLWPPSTSIRAGPPPRNGTCSRLTLAVEPEQLGAEMLEGADAGRGVAQLARLLLGHRQQFLQRIRRQARMHREHIGAGAHDADRRERLDRIVGQLVEPRIDRVRDRDDQDGVAVGRRVRRKLGADDAAGAGAVVDDHLLAEPLAHLRGDGAADDVVAAAGRERDDQPDRPVGIIRLRRGRGRQRNQQSGGGQQQSARFAHRCSSQIDIVQRRTVTPP